MGRRGGGQLIQRDEKKKRLLGVFLVLEYQPTIVIFLFLGCVLFILTIYISIIDFLLTVYVLKKSHSLLEHF